MEGKIIECQDCESRWSIEDSVGQCPNCGSFNFRLMQEDGAKEEDASPGKFKDIIGNRFLCISRNDVNIAISTNLPIGVFNEVTKVFADNDFEVLGWADMTPTNHLILK